MDYLYEIRWESISNCVCEDKNLRFPLLFNLKQVLGYISHFKSFPSLIDLRWVYCKTKAPEGIRSLARGAAGSPFPSAPSSLYPGPTCLPQVFRSCPSAVPLPVVSMSLHGWIALPVFAWSQKCTHMCMHEHAHTYTSLK